MENQNQNQQKSNKKQKKRSKKSSTSQEDTNESIQIDEQEMQLVPSTSENSNVQENIDNNNQLIQQQQQQIETIPVQQNQQQLQTTETSTETNFDNLQRAVQILSRARSMDEAKRYDDALKLYRQGVDILLEELIERQGTDQSRTYLRDKCNDFMNRIDQIKLLMKIESITVNKENLGTDNV